MLGLKNLSLDKLTTVFMVVSAAMMIFAVAGAAGGSASTTMLVVWIVAALVLLGVWAVIAIELCKRFFGGQSSLTGSRSAGNRQEQQTREDHSGLRD